METPPALWELSQLARELDALGRRLAAFQAGLPPLEGTAALGLLRRMVSACEHVQAACRALHGEVPSPPAQEQGLQGTTRTVPLQDLFSFLASTGRTGLLRVDTGAEHFQVQFDRGEVCYAFGDRVPSGEALGDILCAAGVLSVDQLQLLPDRSAQEDWLAPALVDSGWIARRDLESALACQTRSAFLRLCRVGQARYAFEDGIGPPSFSSIRYRPVELLLEASRQWDESRRAGAVGTIPHVPSASRPVAG